MVRDGKGTPIQSQVILKWELYSVGGKVKGSRLGGMLIADTAFEIQPWWREDRELSSVALGIGSKGITVTFLEAGTHQSSPWGRHCPDQMPPSHVIGCVASHLVNWPSADPALVLWIVLWPFWFCFLPDPVTHLWTFPKWFWTQFFS